MPNKIEDIDPFGLEFDKNDVVNNYKDESDPFGDIFDVGDVVNREPEKKKPSGAQPKPVDYKLSSDDAKYRKSASGSGKTHITEDDLKNILNTDEGQRLERGFKDHLQKSAGSSLLSKDDVENIIKTDEGERRKRVFNTEYIGTENPHETNDMRLQKHYMDFLNFTKIAGQKTGFPHSNLLPSEYLNPRQKKIDIVDEPHIKHKKDRPSSVVINRDENGDLESIEFYCKCGERTFLKFDYVDALFEKGLTEVVTAEGDEEDHIHHEEFESENEEFDFQIEESLPETQEAKPKKEDPFSNSEDFKNLSEEDIEKLMFGNIGLER